MFFYVRSRSQILAGYQSTIGVYVRDSLMIKHQKRGDLNRWLSWSPIGLCARCFSWFLGCVVLRNLKRCLCGITYVLLRFEFMIRIFYSFDLFYRGPLINLLPHPWWEWYALMMQRPRCSFTIMEQADWRPPWIRCSISISGSSHPLPYLWMPASMYVIPLYSCSLSSIKQDPR
jgi:hypothetical protein